MEEAFSSDKKRRRRKNAHMYPFPPYVPTSFIAAEEPPNSTWCPLSFCRVRGFI